MSYGYSQTNPAPPVSHHLKCYHKSQYQDDETATLQGTPVSKRVGHFVAKGVEKSKDQQSLVYGSGVSYATGKRADHRTSSEKLKLGRQQMDAEADILRHRERREMENREKRMEKQKDLEMLQQYHPWGKPGAGVPRQSPSGTLCVRKAGLVLDSAPQSRENQQRDAYYPFGRPGAGAPRRTESGTVIAGLAINPGTKFQQRYKDAEPTIYTPPQPPPITPEIESKMREMEKKQHYARRLEEQRREAEERRIEEKSQKDSVYDPWEKDLPLRNDSGKIVGRQRAINEAGFVGEAEGAGGLLGQLDKWREEGKAKRIKRELSSGYDPWGRPGGGAPLASQFGHTVTNVLGKVNLKKQESLTVKEYEYERKGHGLSLAMCMRKGKQTTQQEDKPYHASVAENDRQVEGGVHSYRTELQKQADSRYRQQSAEKKEDRKGDKRHVTRMGELWPLSNHQLKNLQKKEYYSELQKMTEGKQETQQTERKRELESEREHLQTVDRVWGRPGCGAPRVTTGGVVDASPHYSILMSTATHTAHYQFRRV